MNQDYMKTLSGVTTYTTVGSNPFFQFNTPHHFVSQNVNELAQNMVSTVKSGLFRVTTGLLWGSNQTTDNEPPPDPESKLHLCHAFKDQSKTGSWIEMSPDERYSAIIDDHNRVILVDNYLGFVLHIWKGYHRAQIGWITTSWESRKTSEKLPNDLEIGILLVIYLPRRGLLEVWSPEKKFRVVEFHVSKTGRLLNNSNVVLDTSKSLPPSLRTFECAFLEPSGKMFQIYVPVHALTNKACSHDSTIQKQIHNLLETTEDPYDQATELLMTVKSSVTKLTLTVELFRSTMMTVDRCNDILTKLSCQFTENEMALKYLQMLNGAVEFYQFLMKSEHSEEDADFKTALHCSNYEEDILNNLLNLETLDQGKSDKKPLEISEFFRCLNIKSDQIGDESDVHVKFKTKGSGELLKRMCIACQNDPEEMKNQLNQRGISGQTLLGLLLHGCVGEMALQDLIFDVGSSRFSAVCQIAFDLNENDFSQLIQQSRVVLGKDSTMSVKLYVVCLMWKKFMASRTVFEPYIEEWNKALFAMEGFIHILRSYNDLSPNSSEGKYTLKQVFNSGNGRLSELFAEWIIRAEFKEETQAEFLTKCSEYFPCSSKADVVVAHLAWEYFRIWSKDHTALESLGKGVTCLAKVPVAGVRHRLATLAFNAFFVKAAKDAINLTEIRSPVRLERELGFYESSSLCIFLEKLHDILKILLDSETGENQIKKEQFYDEMSVQNVDHLLDHVFKVKPVDDDVISMQYQFVTVALAIWSFGLDDVKPLSLFSNQETNVFFQGGHATSIHFFHHSRGVKNHRKRFVEAACDNAVACIHQTDELDVREYNGWCSKIVLLGKMWNMVDKVKQTQIVALFKGGFDELGTELMNSVPDRKDLGHKLLRVAMLRLSKYIYFDSGESKARMAAVLSPELTRQLEGLKREAFALSADATLKQTSDLLVLVSTLELEDHSHQLAFECLAISQNFRKS